ncbi:MAG: dihydroflavonol 4-reductase [Pseudomonadales bacterium]|jgi:dihydroflavonol-4-reductase|uniref:SDR family oxidoreductase n=1 Tax=unclassified Ketobacter TaxID=2639109 RepID=UPI000C5295D3|nr:MULTISPECIES: SDR family oxidoreductase [unclassified Ketobacter]MAQ26132.1 dihydroflavonol 4-reductase [Pseudomonadales bacterium]MEC8810865.1 SDR family oxidoreductase [Pseudomonadota bacterium]HAG93592.1 dihydroflavonol 4-reductase [Gammaproteobacteria bacterium]MBI26524.1 dihydroflavonol 4-reductase [Pseudomonadales bacterium]RLT88906.1 MAG: NAD-dependent epimerase/dehydratase family protein [Ketobacter sp. GenoA1]|tara:strand:- start:436 stop:1470 length:1035 start_codon:yes stop_codon:yes gene_type:complete
MKKALVTGAAGFIGSHVVDQLTTMGVEVRASALPNENTDNIEHCNPEIVRGDMLDKGFVKEIVEGVDTVFHLAAIYATWLPDWKPLWEVNLQGSRNMLWACMNADNIQKVVYTSSLSAIGLLPGKASSNETTPFNQYDALPYILSKYLSQQEALDFAEQGLNLTVVNPAFPFGPGDVAPTPTGGIILKMIEGGARFSFPGGFNLVDVRDVAAGHILAAEKGKQGEIYILGNENVSGEEFSKMCAEILGKSDRVIPLPGLLVEGGAQLAQFIAENITHSKPYINPKELKYTSQYAYMDCSKARKELGYNPRDVRISLRDSIAWFQSEQFQKRQNNAMPLKASVNY